jgi:protein involved in ribonucleotide reduction
MELSSKLNKQEPKNMKIIYDTRTGLGKTFASSLQFPYQSVTESFNTTESCLLVTRNIGLGKIPKTTSNFLEQHAPQVVGVIVNGSRKYGPYFGAVGPAIAKLYNVLIIRTIEGAGTVEDLAWTREWLQTYSKKKAQRRRQFNQ